jgi:hypothetical protein
MEGGIPMYAELKAGYWDGPYAYIEDGKYVYSAEGSKVDIYSFGISEFIENNYSLHTKGRNQWKDIEKLFVFKLGCYSNKSQGDERANRILKIAKDEFDYIEKINTESFEETKNAMIKNAEIGWTWFQNKDVDLNNKPNMHMHYTWRVYDENGKDQGSNLYNTESIVYSGLWEKLDNNIKEGYYQWVKKLNKTK